MQVESAGIIAVAERGKVVYTKWPAFFLSNGGEKATHMSKI